MSWRPAFSGSWKRYLERHSRVPVVSLLLLAAAVVIVVDHVVPPFRPPVHLAIDAFAFATLIALIVRINVLDATRARRQGAEAQAAAAENDRRVLARELHDSIAQHLCYLHLKLDELSQESACREAPRITGELEQMREVANEAYEEIYSLISSLRLGPSGDLADALHARAILAGQRGGFEINVVRTGESRTLGSCYQQEVISIVREALANAEKHGRAKHVDIEIRWMRDILAIRVRDDGQGFDARMGEKPGHFGLDIMKERAVEMGGTLHVGSKPGEGTVVEFSVPLARVAEPAGQPCPQS